MIFKYELKSLFITILETIFYISFDTESNNDKADKTSLSSYLTTSSASSTYATKTSLGTQVTYSLSGTTLTIKTK